MVLLSPMDVARQLGFSIQALNYHADKGHIRFLRTSTGWRLYRPRDVARFIEWRKQPKTPATVVGRKIRGLTVSAVADIIKEARQGASAK